ncbi:Notch ligand involved in the mediation of Notch signaling (By similarity) [Seminavis robusta]|uniref:Notch ligand involved in the mediation of Notch signaling By similarity n=1 Tax=Seminavis robusta TaxID=568900 RepID=A0A9N8D6C6_9STRA|nr:Notch ligand involved in the mediation of Notch signaling (By similarity) [Seminavis robusta]|eukprot:Sro17_g012330.1 Notch ligand involved in the mediation of Notch signaling (By similarity) (493) ;mRNA; r:80411-81889
MVSFLLVVSMLSLLSSLASANVVVPQTCGTFPSSDRCPRGCYYANAPVKLPNNMIECVQVGQGYYSGDDDNFRHPCSTGEFSNIVDAWYCRQCPKGSFSQGLGNSECTLCPSGTYQDLYGRAWCKPCNSDYLWPFPGADSVFFAFNSTSYCDFERRVLTTAPSRAPSLSPTTSNSPSASAVPSGSPSDAQSPSSMPSVSTLPSSLPTPSPTLRPSQFPSTIPSVNPTTASFEATTKPSMESPSPSSFPSLMPTSEEGKIPNGPGRRTLLSASVVIALSSICCCWFLGRKNRVHSYSTETHYDSMLSPCESKAEEDESTSAALDGEGIIGAEMRDYLDGANVYDADFEEQEMDLSGEIDDIELQDQSDPTVPFIHPNDIIGETIIEETEGDVTENHEGSEWNNHGENTEHHDGDTENRDDDDTEWGSTVAQASFTPQAARSVGSPASTDSGGESAFALEDTAEVAVHQKAMPPAEWGIRNPGCNTASVDTVAL